ncbi:protease [gut metagenome]|uniref:Protease n=1 Tax=gut metagenome TaxID=749906 RepID=J9GC14_9ZZZZ
MSAIELLAPAGNLEKAKTAIRYGANAVYIGGQSFSLRSRASNFNLEQIHELCIFAHEHEAKVHVTVNVIPHPTDFDGLEDYLQALDHAGIDAIISASPAIITKALKMGTSF